jgi:hypothetical protein
VRSTVYNGLLLELEPACELLVILNVHDTAIMINIELA